MNKIKQIFKSHVQGCGSKQISATTGIARNTVKVYLKRFGELKLTWDVVDAMSESDLAELILGKPEPMVDEQRYRVLEAQLPSMAKALRKKA